MEDWSCFSKIQEYFFLIGWFDCEQYGKYQFLKQENNQNSSVFTLFWLLSYYLNITDSLIIPLIFIFFSCCENARNNKEFSCKNSKPCCESQIMNH